MTLISDRLRDAAINNPRSGLTLAGVLWREVPGFRNEFGEFEPGGWTRQDVRLVSVPLSGEEREVLPEGLRETETRKFYLGAAVNSIADMGAGDVLQLGATYYRAEVVRDWAGYREVIASFPVSGDPPS